MTHALPRRTPDLTADPYDIEIGGLVIFHRAGLLRHDDAARAALVEASNDYFWYAHLLEKLNDKTPPWDRGSKNEATPPEVFYETAEWIGHTQSVPNPSIGLEQRHFRLTPRADAANSRRHPDPNEAGSEWSVARAGDQPVVTLHWREKGGPACKSRGCGTAKDHPRIQRQDTTQYLG